MTTDELVTKIEDVLIQYKKENHNKSDLRKEFEQAQYQWRIEHLGKKRYDELKRDGFFG